MDQEGHFFRKATQQGSEMFPGRSELVAYAGIPRKINLGCRPRRLVSTAANMLLGKFKPSQNNMLKDHFRAQTRIGHSTGSYE